MSCAHEIAWYDNVPLLSYAVLRGRCRHCQVRIPLVYPAVELVTALLIAGCVLAFGLTMEAAVAAFFCAVLVAVSAIDLEHRIIPNRIVLPATRARPRREHRSRPEPGVGARSARRVQASSSPPRSSIRPGWAWATSSSRCFMGAALGRTVSVALMVGMLAAMIPGIYLFARHGSKARKMGIPFGPFLAIGSVVALFWGHDILNAYLSTLH